MWDTFQVRKQHHNSAKTVSPDTLFRYASYACNMGTKIQEKEFVPWIDKLLHVSLGWEGLLPRLPWLLACFCHCPVLRKRLKKYLFMFNSIQLVFISNLATARYTTIQNQTLGVKFDPMWTSLCRITALEHKGPIHKGKSDIFNYPVGNCCIATVNLHKGHPYFRF